MKNLVTTVPLLLLIIFCQAQNPKSPVGDFTISGRVLDSAKRSQLEFASISLHKDGAKSAFRSTTADSLGKFYIRHLPAGRYYLTVDFTGYETARQNNINLSAKDPLADLKDVLLQPYGKSLAAVTVTAGPKLIENKIDKLIYNAEKDISSQTGIATDILRKVPQVSVDVNGNVELAGNSGVRFLINGKPSSAFGSNITDVLQSIPASQIKSIEVITNPGAKYDAQGTAGIINIILKKGLMRGINGNLSLAAGTRNDNGSFNINARRGKIGINAFVSANYRPSVNTLFSNDRTTFNTAAGQTELLHQEGISQGTRQGIQTGAGFDWTLKQKNSFTGSFSINKFQNEGENSSWQHHQQFDDVSDSLLSEKRFMSITKNQAVFSNIDAALNYKRTFKKEGRELEVAFNTTSADNRPASENVQVILPSKDPFFGNKNFNYGTDKQSEIRVDFEEPLSKKLNFTAGGKFSNSKINSRGTVMSLDGNSHNYYRNDYLSNSLDYHQQVYALYSELSFPIEKIMDVKIGGRYERTEIDSYFSNAPQQVKTPGYNTFVPTIYLSHKLDDNQQLRLNYSKRIERPNYWDLNPFVNTNDPKNLNTGNPYLKPEISRRVEIGYNINVTGVGYFMAGIFHRRSEQDAQQFIRYYPSYRVGDTTYLDVSVNKKENIGTEKNTGLNVYGDIHLSTALTVRTSAAFYYRYTINELDAGYNTSSLNYRLNANASYQFSPTLIAEFFGNFNSPRNEAQGKYPSFTTYSFGMRKQILNKKASVSLTAQNPFSNFVNQETSIYGPNFRAYSFRQIPFRSFGVNFTWKFGKLEFKKEKEEQNTITPEG